MGQLERYGLYVLVLVIFLILGVAIWGGDPQAADGTNPNAMVVDPETDLSIPSTELPIPGSGSSRSNNFEDLFGELEDLPVDQPPAESGDEVADPSSAFVEGMNAAEKEAETVAAPASLATTQRSYKIRRFDSYSEIAKRELGSAQRWREIERLNPGIDAKNLPIGKVIKLPGTSSSGAEVAMSSSTQRKHTMKEGEYLGSVSQLYYGTSRHAELIKDANNISNARTIKAGTVLIIPPLPENK